MIRESQIINHHFPEEMGWFIDTFAGHTFGAHWGTTLTGRPAVIRRCTSDRRERCLVTSRCGSTARAA